MHWLIAQRWEQLLFAHWPVDARAARRLLPPPVEPDLWEGDAWVGIVAFVMGGTRPWGWATRPTLPPIPELNVDVRPLRWGAGGLFLSLDTNSPLFVTLGRALFGLRYRLARMAAVADGEAALSQLGG